MRTAIAEDLPHTSPVVVALSAFIMVCLTLLVLEVGLMVVSHVETMPQPIKAHTVWRSLTL